MRQLRRILNHPATRGKTMYNIMNCEALQKHNDITRLHPGFIF
jgi:hypothetical protein